MRVPLPAAMFMKRESSSSAVAAFTLIEVMIALAIFFMALFAILGVVSQGLRAAGSLQQDAPDMGLIAAELLLPPRIEEEHIEGDFGEHYPQFRWFADFEEVRTNGLFRVDVTILGLREGQRYESRNSMLLWRPNSTLGQPGLPGGPQ